MSKITTHVLDTALGRPGVDIAVELAFETADGWVDFGRGTTDADGRVSDLLPVDQLIDAGVYRLRFATGDYAAATERGTFYPRVDVVFEISDPQEHHHVPLLLNPYGYATYRGS